MAQAKQTSRLFGAFAGAAMTAAAVFAPAAASAQEATPAAQNQPVWTEELRQLDAADRAATEYARDNYGVGILIHVGQDIPNSHFASADEFGQAIVRAFNQKYGVEAQYFLRQNDARATGITYHIDTFIHGADNGTAVKNVKEALNAMTEVVEYLKIAKEDRVAQIEPASMQP
ncbi:hypothetical protein ACSSV1_003630 [Labrenzia sp. MBR-25]